MSTYPSNGDFHRYPLDCWRFYPDAGVALVRWAGRRGIQIELIESFIGLPQAERWADFVAVFRKAGGTPLASKGRISDHVPAINVHRLELSADEPLGGETESMPDTTIAANLSTELAAAKQDNAMLSADLAGAEQINTSLSADLAAARQGNATLSAYLTTAEADLGNSRQHNDALSAELKATQEAAGGLRRDLNSAGQRIGDLENALADLRRDLAAIENSTSWRMTAGLRWLKIRLRGK